MTSFYSTFALTQPSVSATWRAMVEDLSHYLDALTTSNTEAFELSQSGKVRQLLQKLEQQHAQYKFELDSLLNISQVVENAPKLHHSWSNVRDTFTEQRAESDIVKECLRGELITLEQFDRALQGSLPKEARVTLQRQRLGLATAVQHLSQWTL